ncbi:MAG: RNA polymerase sigma factor [Candidatus Nealsonbacteria bacterium]|nr:RNA polymerase sigma factor [Candidatus Nealsonbacteria bacterium]
MPDFKKKFSRIFDQHINKIYRFVYLKVNSQEIAQDITSEVFLRGWQAFKKAYNPCPMPQNKIKNISAFLYQIARNLVIDHYREKQKKQTVSIENMEIVDPGIGLEEKAAIDSDIEQIRKGLLRLKQDYQDVIIWHYLDDLSVSEIAKILNKPETTVRVMIHRGLKHLRALIQTE